MLVRSTSSDTVLGFATKSGGIGSLHNAQEPFRAKTPFKHKKQNVCPQGRDTGWTKPSLQIEQVLDDSAPIARF